MKLVADKFPGVSQFTSYGPDWVKVNGETRQGSLMVGPQHSEAWRPAGFADLQRGDFAAVLAQRPELVLLGTGSRIRFPHPGLYRDLTDAGIGVEVMDLGALCRTFNALVGEGRRAVALVLFD